MRRILIALIFLSAPSLSRAALPVGALQVVNNPDATTTFLASTALNAAPSALTFRLTNPRGEYAYANLELARTRVAGSDLTMTCKSTTTPGGTPAAVRTTCTYDALGVCTSLTATRKSSTSLSETLAWVVNIAGWQNTDCTLASSSAGGSDFIAVTGNMVTK